MNIRDLRYLVAIAEHQHFGKAATACFVSQPTLSAQLKKLEEELEVRFFERSNKKIVITEAGKNLLAQAQVVLREVEQLYQLAKQVQDPFSGPYRLGIIPTIAPYLLPQLLPLIKQHFANLELILHEEKTHTIVEQVDRGQLDAAILALPIHNSGLVSQELYRESFFVALPSQHPLQSKKLLQLNDLVDQPLLLLADGHCFRDQALAVCHMAGAKANTAYHATSLEILRHMVASGNGITLMPALAVHPDNSITVTRPFSPPVPFRTVGMLWRKRSVRLKLNEALIDLVRTHIHVQ